jgi:signal transduction histidine kinase
MVGRPRPFRLFRFFATASVVAIATVTAVVGWLFARAAHDDAVEEGRDFAALVVAHIEARVVESGLRDALEPAAGAPVAGLEGERAARFDAAVRSAIAGLRVLRVHVFDLEGRIIYTTAARPPDPWWRNGSPIYHEAVLGRSGAKLTDRVHHAEASGAGEEFALEAYVPIRDADGRVRSVVEIYQDARALVAGIRAATLRVAAVSFASMLATVLALFAVFRRGDRTIRERTREIEEANAALADLTGRLEREVAVRTARLVDQERLAALGTVAAGIAHEVNNPLAAIATAAEALIRRCEATHGAEIDPVAKDYLEIVRDEAFRAKAITRDLLDFARKDEREAAASPAPVDVNEVARGVAALLELRPRRRGAELLLETAPDGALPPVLGRAGKLRQALFNIADNALDAVEAKGSPGRVILSTALERGEDGAAKVAVRCSDDGVGMSDETRRRALEPFFTTKEPGEGTGLGLSIAWGIIESHGGAIEVASAGLGRGATVTVRLPAAPAGAAPASPDPAAADRVASRGGEPIRGAEALAGAAS